MFAYLVEIEMRAWFCFLWKSCARSCSRGVKKTKENGEKVIFLEKARKSLFFQKLEIWPIRPLKITENIRLQVNFGTTFRKTSSNYQLKQNSFYLVLYLKTMEMEVNNDGGHDDDNDDMAVAEKFDTTATIAFANEQIREILHRMEHSLQIANKAEQSTMIQEFTNLYPQVTSKEFYENGAHKHVFHLVRDARCFFLVMQWNKGDNGNFTRKVSCAICSILSLLFLTFKYHFSIVAFTYLCSHAYCKLE